MGGWPCASGYVLGAAGLLQQGQLWPRSRWQGDTSCFTAGQLPAIHFRYFWGTTVALYSAFTLKVAPHMSKTENLENVCICAVIAAMAAAST